MKKGIYACLFLQIGVSLGVIWQSCFGKELWQVSLGGGLFLLGLGIWFLISFRKQTAFWQERKRKEAEEERHWKKEKERWEQEIVCSQDEGKWLRRMLSHNVRMPMAVIAGYGDLLKNGNLQGQEAAYIGKICSNIDYLKNLLAVVLDSGKEAETGKREYFDLLSCAGEVAEYVRRMAAREGITISVNSSKREVWLHGSRVEMMRVFYNLLENSLKYMRRKGGIYITVEECAESVMVIYRDEGEGMEEEEAEKITGLLYRGSNAEGAGQGMGMYMVKRSVENNGGSLSIKTGKQKGMAVYMSFPIKGTQDNL